MDLTLKKIQIIKAIIAATSLQICHITKKSFHEFHESLQSLPHAQKRWKVSGKWFS